MSVRAHFGRMLVAGSVWAACASVASSAQSTPPDPAPCTVAPQPVPCGTAPAQSSKPPDKPANSDKFPFPGENSNAGDTAKPPASSAPGAAADPAAAAKKSSGADFPFPGEPDAAGSGDSSSSSGSSSSAVPDSPDADSPDAAGLKDKGSEGTQSPRRGLLHKVGPAATKPQTPEEREAEDLDVARFYTETGDLKGAYLRGQDAVKTAPDDPDAHFALAESALKLNKRDEAIAEYTACLKLDPVDKEAKAARKELARLKP